jgi:hypothetical protein
MQSSLILILSILFCCISASAQQLYTDKGHWIGFDIGYVPSGDNIAYLAKYEYRFARNWSIPLELADMRFSRGYSLILSGGLRLRIPMFKFNKNIYGQFGFSAGSMYPVLYGSLGAEYGITEDVSVNLQYRKYTSNFDYLKPNYSVYLLGINIDITPKILRQSYLLKP